VVQLSTEHQSKYSSKNNIQCSKKDGHSEDDDQYDLGKVYGFLASGPGDLAQFANGLSKQLPDFIHGTLDEIRLALGASLC